MIQNDFKWFKKYKKYNCFSLNYKLKKWHEHIVVELCYFYILSWTRDELWWTFGNKSGEVVEQIGQWGLVLFTEFMYQFGVVLSRRVDFVEYFLLKHRHERFTACLAKTEASIWRRRRWLQSKHVHVLQYLRICSHKIAKIVESYGK